MTQELKSCGCNGSTAKAKFFVDWNVGAKLKLIFILVFSLMLVGCKTVQPISIKTLHDSIYVRDSVIINNLERVVDSIHIVGDTIHHYHINYVYTTKEVWRDKNQVCKDSVQEFGTMAPKAPKFYKRNTSKWWLYLLVLLVGLCFVVKRYR